MTTLNDILSSNLLDKLWTITPFDIVISQSLAFMMGLFIMIIYRRIYQGVMYSGSFAASLVALTMIVTTLILAVTSNIVLSLGMIGALSIVRFRTAIKDPLEIVFLFWSIEVGIVLASGMLGLAIGVNILIGCILQLLVVRKSNPYILVIKCDKSSLSDVLKILSKCTYYTIKSRKVVSRSLSMGNRQAFYDEQPLQLELDIEVTLNNRKVSGLDETEFVDKISAIQGVYSAILVTYNGGYM